jgi:hypothetical protein
MPPYLVLLSMLLIFRVAPLLQVSDDSASVPTVSFALPAQIRSETVQVRYMLTGPFGGYSSYLRSKPNVPSCEISAVSDGKPANSIKIVIYASGCRFQTLTLNFSGTRKLQYRFACDPLPTIQLKGKIPIELLKNQNAEVVAIYTAYWAQEFLGILHGMVTQLQLARARPDDNGEFEMEIPDSALDPHSPSVHPAESFGLVLRNSETLNPIAFNLEPELPQFGTPTNQLRIQPAYPREMSFVPSLETKH